MSFESHATCASNQNRTEVAAARKHFPENRVQPKLLGHGCEHFDKHKEFVWLVVEWRRHTRSKKKNSACEYKYQCFYLRIHKWSNQEAIFRWKFPFIEQRCPHACFFLTKRLIEKTGESRVLDFVRKWYSPPSEGGEGEYIGGLTYQVYSIQHISPRLVYTSTQVAFWISA